MRWKLLIPLLLIVLCISPAWASPQTIITEGTYVMGDGETPAVAEEKAFLQAKRVAIEQAGTYIESYSKTNNFELVQDDVQLIAAGAVETIKLENHRTLDDNGLLKFWVKVKCNITPESIDVMRERIRDKNVRDAIIKANNEHADDFFKQSVATLQFMEVTAKGITNVAEAVARKGDFKNALDLLDMAIAIDPNLLTAYSWKALIYSSLGKRADAFAALNLMHQHIRDENGLRFYEGAFALINK